MAVDAKGSSEAQDSETGRGAQLDRFNLETMSGVYPGTRTQVWQRIRLVPLGGASAGVAPTWAIIYWYDAPPSAVITLQDGVERSTIRLDEPLAGDFTATLNGALAAERYGAFICGSCAHWQPGAGATVDGLPLGACALRRDLSHHPDPLLKEREESQPHPDPLLKEREKDEGARGGEQVGRGSPTYDAAVQELPLLLTGQSALALGCVHWEPRAAGGGRSDTGVTHSLQPLPKIAEISESKMKPLRRWRVRLRRWLSPPPPAPDLEARLIERSGVGAGTEPCPCCQGRIANLGALAVESASGDKETLSVWRCRVCHVLLLSDWIDRWERADSLETEETMHRIAPVEAAEILTLIASVTGGEHPRQRAERNAERDWIHAQVAGREPLSHMVKQGR